MDERRFSAEELSAITGLARRTIRYYVQEELIEKPIGEKNAAYYTDRHLADLLLVKEKAASGYKLSGIRTILARRRQEPQAAASAPSQQVWAHLDLSADIKLLINPASACVSTPPQDLRAFINGVFRLYQETILHHHHQET
ncbi:MAG: helix-turn-helix domain-containing protein [Betaproteobacteria bacterium]|nr:helix-turn-helix domain-containing protein [Betaproteobacteria bacterium]